MTAAPRPLNHGMRVPDPGPGFLSCPVLLARDCPEFGAGRLSSTSWPWFFPTLGLLMPYPRLSESPCPPLNYSSPPKTASSPGASISEKAQTRSHRDTPNPIPEGGGNTVEGSRPDTPRIPRPVLSLLQWSLPSLVGGGAPPCVPLWAWV